MIFRKIYITDTPLKLGRGKAERNQSQNRRGREGKREGKGKGKEKGKEKVKERKVKEEG